MVKIYPIIGAVLSLASLILLAIGTSTNKWVILTESRSDLNPLVVNSKLGSLETRLGVTKSTFKITYSATHFGLWIGCHKEHKSAVSCAYIGSKCFSNVCWVRQALHSRRKTCLDSRFVPVSNCVAFQFVRAFIVMGMILLLFGVCTQCVSLITVKRSLAMLAGLVVFAAGLCVMIGFAIFYSEGWLKSGLAAIGHRGYSFTLIIISWPLALVGGITSCFAASMGLRHKEVSDYSASNY